MKRLLVLTSYPDQAACTRFRISAFVPALERAGIEVVQDPFLSPDLFASFYDATRRKQNALGVARAVARRVRTLLSARRFDAVFVQREAALLGPAIVEEIFARGARLPLIYDIDDAVWLAGKGASTNASRYPLLSRLLKAPTKSLRLMRIASTVIAGSQHLARFASQYNDNTEVLPTVVSKEDWRPKPGREDGAWATGGPPVIGWIGTHSTAPQLEMVLPALKRLRSEGREFRLRVVGGGEDFSLDGFDFENVKWQGDREIEDFASIDIGLGPMFHDEWSEGKCGFKQVQYMAVGVPMVTSVAGGARDFVVDEENALVVPERGDWYEPIRRLLDEPALRGKLSANGRRVVETSYSREVLEPRFVSVVTQSGQARGRYGAA